MGYGKKAMISAALLKNAATNPSPNRYNFENYFLKARRQKRGRTFGISRCFYDNVYIPG